MEGGKRERRVSIVWVFRGRMKRERGNRKDRKENYLEDVKSTSKT